MSLQLILGNSGSGKSTMLYKEVIEKSIKNPDVNYIVIVPEQFTMSTQRKLVMSHPDNGIMNIDVMSFQRLAYRVFEETGAGKKTVLEETGKNLILKRIADKKENELVLLKSNLKKVGYINEVKSFISEMAQYKVRPEDIEKIIEESPISDSLRFKLKDLLVMYKGFKEYLADTFITAEEILEQLSNEIKNSETIKNSVIVLDGFTGFTPIQYQLLKELIIFSKKVIVTVTIDTGIDVNEIPKEHELFKLSKDTINRLKSIAGDIAKENNLSIENVLDEPVVLKSGENYRFKNKKGLAFLEKNLFRYNNEKYTEKQDEISIHVMKNPEAEIEYVAGEIKRLVYEENYRFKDIGIVSGNVELYSRYGRDIMADNNIPYFVDIKRDVLKNPFIESIRAMLEMVDRNFSYESVFRFLKSGLSGLENERIDIIENYCLAFGKRGFNQWNKEWKAKGKKYSDEDLEIINAIREEIISKFQNVQPLLTDKNTNVKSKIRSIYDFLYEEKYQEKICSYENYFKNNNELMLAKEYSQIFKTVIDLFDKIVELLGDETMDLRELIEILDAGFAEIKIGIIPPGLDMVTIGDIERTRLDDIKVLFFVGVNEGIIPSSDNGGGIISQSEREVLTEKIQIAPTIREKSFIQRFYLYLNMTKPCERLYLSYSKIDNEGKSLKSSYLISSIKKMYPVIEVVDEEENISLLDNIYSVQSGIGYLANGFEDAIAEDADTEWYALLSWYMDNEEYKRNVLKLIDSAFYKKEEEILDKDIAKALYGEILRNSVTRLESFTKCAFAHFAKYGLNLQEREQFSFENVDMGNNIHRALEIFTMLLKEKHLSWHDLSDEDSEHLAKESLKVAVEEMATDILHSNARNEYMIKRMEKILMRTVDTLRYQMKKGDFETDKCEELFNIRSQFVSEKTKELFEICLTGRIDRIDTYSDGKETYIKIIDYKTGSKDFSLNELYYGLSMQLIVYMIAATEKYKQSSGGKTPIPAGLFYYNVKEPVVDGDINMSDEEVENSILKSLRMKGIVNADTNIINKLDKDFESASNVIPVSKNKDNSFSKSSSVASTEQFDDMAKYIEKKIVEIGMEILSGNIDTKPFDFEGKTGCDYCQFSSVCKFDKKMGYSFNKLIKQSDEEIWQKINESVRGGEE